MKLNSYIPSALWFPLFLTAMGLLIGFPGQAFSQTQDPYLVSATFYLSVDDWADLWLNGVPIVDSQPHTPANADTKIITAKPNSLCYFSRENILAIEITKTTLKNKFAADPSVGFGYFLSMKLSDGREVVLSSNEADQHRALYLQGQEYPEPTGWHDKFFNDASWGSALSTVFRLPSCSLVKDPESGSQAVFLSARASTPEALHPGERHLFRRYFSLPISPNPRCLTPTPGGFRAPVFVPAPQPRPRVVSTPAPQPRPMVLKTPTPVPLPKAVSIQPMGQLPEGPRHENMPHPHWVAPAITPIFTRTWTFIPTHTLPFTSTRTPTATFIPVSTATPTFSPTFYFAWYPTATFTPWPRVYTQPASAFAIPTPVPIQPTPIPPAVKKVKRTQILHSATRGTLPAPVPAARIPTLLPSPTSTVQWVYQAPPSTPTALPVLPLWATPTPAPAGADSQAETLEVPMPPANLYVNFADGPGLYRLSIYDSRGKLIRAIYEKRAVHESEDWAIWDGKTETGQAALSGYYRVVFTLNGVHLKDVILHLVSGNP